MPPDDGSCGVARPQRGVPIVTEQLKHALMPGVVLDSFNFIDRGLPQIIRHGVPSAGVHST